MRRLIYDGDSVYELDEDCVSKNKEITTIKSGREERVSETNKETGNYGRDYKKPGAF